MPYPLKSAAPICSPAVTFETVFAEAALAARRSISASASFSFRCFEGTRLPAQIMRIPASGTSIVAPPATGRQSSVSCTMKNDNAASAAGA